MHPIILGSWLFFSQSFNPFLFEPFIQKKKGVTYTIQFEQTTNDQLKGTLQANGITFKLEGQVSTGTIKGTIESEEKLSFDAHMVKDKLHFDIYKRERTGFKSKTIGQLLILESPTPKDESNQSK